MGTADGTATTLRVASFNIRSGLALDGRHLWPFRRRAVAAALTELDADLIGVQEGLAFQLHYLLGKLPAYASVGAGRTDGRARGEQCALLYRTDRLTIQHTQTRWLSPTPEKAGSRGWGAPVPRVATLARFRDRHSGLVFGAANTHWEGGSALARRHSASLLLEWLSPEVPWVLLGDLNATVADPAVRLLLAAGFKDALAATPARGRGAGTHHDFSGTTDGTRIDHILLTPAWQVHHAAVLHPRPDGRLPSDHWPVVATIAH